MAQKKPPASRKQLKEQLKARSRAELTLDELSAFRQELTNGSPRASVLVASSLVDVLLRDTLEVVLRFRNGDEKKELLTGLNAPLGTFSARSRLLFALGVIDAETYDYIDTIRTIRNEFAHGHAPFSFDTHEVAALCGTLPKPKIKLPKGVEMSEARSRFVGTCLSICQNLPRVADAFQGRKTLWSTEIKKEVERPESSPLE
jgi:DNA-binding MltR family transcriptional regulator